ncbi:MAG: G8 domain-containing protein [Kangiellaceae bacterium]|nr:G8 domain-containing protein [Kangiellaceae bacterium]
MMIKPLFKIYHVVVLCLTLALIFNISACGSSETNVVQESPPSGQDTPTSATTTTSPVMVSSGNWSDENTWQDKAFPADGSEFVVPGGYTLIVDGEISSKVKTLTIDGALIFSHDRNTQLNVGTLIANHESLLQIGTAEQPVSASYNAKIMFADFGPITQQTDAKQLRRGAILKGKVVVYGAQKTAWSGLLNQPIAGESSVTLKQTPHGWKAGDRLVIAATDPKDPASDELVTINSIDGETIHLSSPLLKDHRAPKSDLTVHIANLSRNIEFYSENPSIKHRGHVMFMHNLDVDVNYARFYQLGRTDKSVPLDDWSFPNLDESPPVVLERENIRGRYSVHFHRGGVDINAVPAKIRGNVVEDDPGWAYVNHSSNVDFIDNVSYKVVGGAYQTEAGDELGSFINNIALHTVNPTFPLLDGFQGAPDFREDRQDFAFQGDAFWIHGGGVKLEGNVVAGASGHAFIYWPEGLIEPNTGMMKFKTSNIPNANLPESIQQIDIWYVPTSSFKNNTAYSATKGLTFFYLHSSFFRLEEQVTAEYLENLHSTFEDVLLWNMRQNAVELNFTEKVTFKNFRLYGNGDKQVIGVDANHFHNMNDLNFENFHIEGFGIGMDVPTQGKINIEGGHFANLTDFRVANPQANSRHLSFNNISFGSSEYFNQQEQVKIEMKPDFTLIAEVQNGLESEDSVASKHPLFFLMPDRIYLNFNEFNNRSLYFLEQIPDFIPMTSANKDGPNGYSTPQQYVDKTNQTLLNEFGVYFGSTFKPDDASTSTLVKNGLVGSPSNSAVVMPPEIDF